MTTAVSFPEPDPSDLPDAEESSCVIHRDRSANFRWLLHQLANFDPVSVDGSTAAEADPSAACRHLFISFPASPDGTAIDVLPAIDRWYRREEELEANRDGGQLIVGGVHEGNNWGASAWTGGLRTRVDRWDRRVRAFRVVPASKATLLAGEVSTLQEMGQALRLLREEAGLTIDQLANRVAAQRIAGTRRSTIGRVFAGGTLCATREALVVLVKACGVDDTDVEVWVAAWERARSTQSPRGRRPATALTGTPVANNATADGEVTACTVSPVDEAIGQLDTANTSQAGSRTGLAAVDDVPVCVDDDEVIGTVQITRGHLRTAVVLSAVAGLAATSSPTPAVRNVGAAVLGVAGVIALIEVLRAHTGAAGPTAMPEAA